MPLLHHFYTRAEPGVRFNNGSGKENRIDVSYFLFYIFRIVVFSRMDAIQVTASAAGTGPHCLQLNMSMMLISYTFSLS